MQLLKLVQSQVQLRVPLPWGVRDAHGNLLLAKGQVISSESQLELLLERGASVDIEEVRAAAAAHAAAAAPPAVQRVPSLFNHWEDVLWQLDRVLRSVQAEPGFGERIDALAREIATLTLRDPDIAIYLTVRQDPKRLTIYALAHSVHCAMLAVLMARRLGWDEPRLWALVKAALTMNVSILDLQGHMAAQDKPVTPAQLDEIRVHPGRAVELLQGAGIDDALWLDAVHHHHERPDGTGYPAGLQEIGELATVLRHIDVFMAKMAPRALRAPLTAQVAARELFRDSGGAPVAAAIIKEFGIYPPGEFVQLKSGELAVVVRRTADGRAPQVACITDKKGAPTVSSTVRDTSKPEFAIVALPTDKALVHRVPPERLFGLPE